MDSILSSNNEPIKFLSEKDIGNSRVCANLIEIKTFNEVQKINFLFSALSSY